MSGYRGASGSGSNSTSSSGSTGNSGILSGNSFDAKASIVSVDDFTLFDLEATGNSLVGEVNKKKQKIEGDYGVITDEYTQVINQVDSELLKGLLEASKLQAKAQREIAKSNAGIESNLFALMEVIAISHNFNVQKHSAEMMMQYDLKTAINGETQNPATDNLFKAQKEISDKLENIGDSSDIVEELKNLINLENLSKLDNIESYKDELAHLSKLDKLESYKTELGHLSKLGNIKSYSTILTNIKNAISALELDPEINFDTESLETLLNSIKTSLDTIKTAIDEKEVSLEAGDINMDLTDTNTALNSIAGKIQNYSTSLGYLDKLKYLKFFDNINQKTNSVNNLVDFWSETKEFFNFMNKKPSADKESPRQLMTNYWLENSITFQKINSITVNSSTLSGFTYDRANTQSSIFSKVKSIFNFKI